MAQMQLSDHKGWMSLAEHTQGMAMASKGLSLGGGRPGLRVKLINAIESRGSGVEEAGAGDKLFGGGDDLIAKRRRLVFQEEQLGFLDLPDQAHWLGGKPSLQELKSRMAASLQLQEQVCTSPSFIVQYSSSHGVLTPIHSDIELQGLLSSWMEPGCDPEHKLYVSLASGPSTRPSHAPETPVLSPGGPKATSRTFTDFSANSIEGAPLTGRMSSILLPSFSLDLEVLAKSNSLVTEPNPSMMSHVLDNGLWAAVPPCGQTLEIHTGETTHGASPKHHPFGNVQAPSPPPPAPLQDGLAAAPASLMGDLLLAPIRTATAAHPLPQPSSATSQNYPALNAPRVLSPLGPPATGLTVDSGYAGPPKSHAIHTSHLKVPIVTTGGPPAATPTNRLPDTPGADSTNTFVPGSKDGTPSNSPAKSCATPRRGARRVGPGGAQPSESLLGAPSVTDDTNAQEAGSDDDGTQVGSKKRPGPSKGRGSRPSKGRETETKYADGRKKCEAAHQNSMNGMIDACRNMFGPLSHLVQVVDYKHIRCLACEPQQDVKAYSAYHTACIRKHFLRHHQNMLFDSEIDLTHFREYKVSAKGATGLISTPSGNGLTTAGSTGTSGGMDLKRGRLSSLVSDPDPGSPRSSRRRTAANASGSPSASGFTQQQMSTPTSATPRSTQFMPSSPHIQHVLTHNPGVDAVNHMGSPFNPGTGYGLSSLGSPMRPADAMSVPWNQGNLKPVQQTGSMTRPWMPSGLHISSGGGGLPGLMQQPQLQGNGMASGASSPMRQAPSTAAALAGSPGLPNRMGVGSPAPQMMPSRVGGTAAGPAPMGWDLPNLPNLNDLDAHLATLSGGALGALLDPMSQMAASRQTCQVPPPSRHNLGRTLLDIPRSPAGMHSPGRMHSPRGTSQGGLLPVAPLMSSPAHVGAAASNLGRLPHVGPMGATGIPDSPPHNQLNDSMDPQFMSEFLSSLKSISNATTQLSAQLAADQAGRVKTPGLDPSSRRGTHGGDPYSNAASSPRPMNMHLDKVGSAVAYQEQAHSPRPMIPQGPAYGSAPLFPNDSSLLGGSSFMNTSLTPNKDMHAAHSSWASGVHLSEPATAPMPPPAANSPMVMHSQSLLAHTDPMAPLSSMSAAPLPPVGDLPPICPLPDERASQPGLPTVNSDDDDLPGFGFCSDKLMGYSLTQLLRQEQDELDAGH